MNFLMHLNPTHSTAAGPWYRKVSLVNKLLDRYDEHLVLDQVGIGTCCSIFITMYNGEIFSLSLFLSPYLSLSLWGAPVAWSCWNWNLQYITIYNGEILSLSLSRSLSLSPLLSLFLSLFHAQIIRFSYIIAWKCLYPLFLHIWWH
jgi:hypothetical protein